MADIRSLCVCVCACVCACACVCVCAGMPVITVTWVGLNGALFVLMAVFPHSVRCPRHGGRVVLRCVHHLDLRSVIRDAFLLIGYSHACFHFVC